MGCGTKEVKVGGCMKLELGFLWGKVCRCFEFTEMYFLQVSTLIFRTNQSNVKTVQKYIEYSPM